MLGKVMPAVRRTVALISCKKHEMSVRWGSRQSITIEANGKGDIYNIFNKIRHQSTASPQVVSAEDGLRLKVAAKIFNKQHRQPTTGCLRVWGLDVGITFVRTNLSCYRTVHRSLERIPVKTVYVLGTRQKKNGGFLSCLSNY